MLINPNGDLYRSNQLLQMIEQAGFEFERTIQTGGVYDVMVAKKLADPLLISDGTRHDLRSVR